MAKKTTDWQKREVFTELKFEEAFIEEIVA